MNEARAMDDVFSDVQYVPLMRFCCDELLAHSALLVDTLIVSIEKYLLVGRNYRHNCTQ